MRILVKNCQFRFLSSGVWKEILNSSLKKYGGTEEGFTKEVLVKYNPLAVDHNDPSIPNYSMSLDIPRLSVTFFKKQ